MEGEEREKDEIVIPPKLYKIGEVMYYSGLSRQILHNYTQLGLIREAARTPSGHRLYSEDVFVRLKRIKELKAQGHNLLDIKQILKREMPYPRRDGDQGDSQVGKVEGKDGQV